MSEEFNDTGLDELDGAAHVALVDFSRPTHEITETTRDGVLPPASADGSGPAEPARPRFANAAEWVEQWLIPHYKRNPQTHLWDDRWWEYTEVIAVFEALWQAWEFLRTDSMTGPAVFFRDYLWPAMRELTGPEGPFWRTKGITERALPDPWNTTPAPAGMFRAADHPDEQ